MDQQLDSRPSLAIKVTGPRAGLDIDQEDEPGTKREVSSICATIYTAASVTGSG